MVYLSFRVHVGGNPITVILETREIFDHGLLRVHRR